MEKWRFYGGHQFQSYSFHEEENLFQDWSLDYLLLGEDEPFFTHHFSTSVHSNFVQDELYTLFDGDILSIWGDMKEDAYHRSDKDGGEKEEKLDHEKAMELQLQRLPSGRQSGEKTLTFELVSQYFCLPIKQAAQELNVGLTLLKRRCRVLGIPRWPHRKVKSLETIIKNVQELGMETGQDEDNTRNAVEMLQQTKKLIEQSPDAKLDDWTKMLRQACFKENYKRRRLLAIEG
ncbi:protein RKD1 [Oryza sativa Japonica Group]|uniref:RWP-RK domain-containing protein-like n=2 Tax=Oryza sativa subsp. japonica TaxID=39947 RepID=A3ABB1_ORYSJ|nr:protein RKD1 [Oryza sativa Japonica Group]XP_015627115.1 protein RKD1 [Oryza sativa Japonica Group]EAZ24600.1 hypothetical protein OsJ_08362 [Oryza sativa Japonica Group]KAF2946932.1 hypothetical protein DAI22_02g331400 [Oryza sativa Japonica Group]KAF2946933.1 hypothetical protein DAI22_02g331400 [Oryza sativa Japonica Group]KAF2946934.1 hypothetical protein DAI22_02g331400 [Oryza sativa Japonica Group]KAF2946935.1 hypothetical protein DAI22_02g331400 [Oryza sativa Japonica Group]